MKIITHTFFLLILFTGFNVSSSDETFPQKRSTFSNEVNAILYAYGNMIDRVERDDENFVFIIREIPIYYANGKMLSEKNLPRQHEFNSFFYKYQTGQFQEIPQSTEFPRNRSNDLLNALLGDTDHEIRSSSRWISFLDRRVYVHRICVEPLKKIDAQLKEYANYHSDVKKFISEISVIFSMKRRLIEGTNNLSYHSYGLALDIIPTSYEDKHVYWRWSSVFDKDWGNIPLSRRWQPPHLIIDTFEKNGFVWGGKWYYFDNVHFEYRPEIIYLAENGSN